MLLNNQCQQKCQESKDTYNLMHTQLMNSTEHFFHTTLTQLIHKTIFENRKHAIH